MKDISKTPVYDIIEKQKSVSETTLLRWILEIHSIVDTCPLNTKLN